MSWLRWRRPARAAVRTAVLAAAAAAFLALAAFSRTGPGPSQAVPRRLAVEVPMPATSADEAALGRPLALALDADRLYVADALDCAVKIFARDGRFLKSFGHKGQGPGELSFPSGICVAGEAIAVADKFNFRIQIFDREGNASGGFRLPFAPDRVVSLEAGRLLVTANPDGRRQGQRLLHIYDLGGNPVWSGLEARAASDPVSAAFRNMILAGPDGSGGFFVIYRCGERSILHGSSTGGSLSRVAVDERQASVSAVLPAAGQGLKLDGFCWAAASDRGLVYFSAPLAIDGQDLGPGRSISVLDSGGRLRSTIDLPCAVHRFLVADGRLFAIDEEGSLRVFEVGR